MSAKAAPAGSDGPGVLGRRLSRRREQLGLSRQEVAHRAGMAPAYVQYLEEEPAGPSREGLFRLAGALETTVADLTGGAGPDLPPGRGPAAPHPELLPMGPEECRTALSTHGVGRLVLTTPRGITVLPVNYSVEEDAVAFRTAPGSVTATAAGREVAFEVDRVDEALSEGWSVLITGHAQQVTDPDEVRRLTERSPATPWAGGDRNVWIRIGVEHLTGRRIRTRDPAAGT